MNKMNEKFDVMTNVLAGLNNQAYLQRQQNERQLLLQGRIASWNVRSMNHINNLEDVEFCVSSQWGEDGIIDWIIEQLELPSSTFVEIGVENYKEANTRFLLQNRNWRGVIFDSNEQYMESVRDEALYWRFDISAVAAHITRENINSLLEEQCLNGDIGMLSIDIDGNDYWVIEAINLVSPKIIVCEYNPIFGDLYSITVPYRSDFERFAAHHCGLYFGSSIKALQELTDRKGYAFVGSCSNGINAFFVRKDMYQYIDGKIETLKAYPSRHRDARDKDGKLIYTSGTERAALIEEMMVLDLGNNSKPVVLKDLGRLYSEEWLQGMS